MNTQGKRWRTAPPETPGLYVWRRSWQWEPVTREVNSTRTTFSHRYEKEVPLETVGGEWLY